MKAPPFHIPSDIPISAVRYFDTLDSTNTAALEWSEQGAPDMALVVADEQTAGRGRFQRRWLTPPGAALAFSLLVRPTPREAQDLGAFSPWGALGVAAALELAGLEPQIKWPNDVLLGGRKVCGILVESSWLGTSPQAVVVGIGVNVTRPAAPPDEAVLFPATSVEAALKAPADRWTLLADILQEMAKLRPWLGTPSFYGGWERRLAFRGEWVQIGPGDGRGDDRLGQVLGLAPDGALRLRAETGEEFIVQVGEMHLRPAD